MPLGSHGEVYIRILEARLLAIEEMVEDDRATDGMKNQISPARNSVSPLPSSLLYGSSTSRAAAEGNSVARI